MRGVEMAEETDGGSGGSDHPRNEGRMKMQQLIARGVVKSGQQVFFQYKRVWYMALVEKDGRLAMLEGDRFETPSDFANDMVKRYNSEHRIKVRGSVNMNGWQTCTVSDEKKTLTLQDLIDLPDNSADRDSPPQAEEAAAEGDRKRKRQSTDAGVNNQNDLRVARALRKRRTTRLAAGKIKQVDYKFPSGTGTDNSGANAVKQQHSAESEDDSGEEGEKEETAMQNEEDMENQSHDIGYDDEEGSKVENKTDGDSGSEPRPTRGQGSQVSSGPEDSLAGSEPEKNVDGVATEDGDGIGDGDASSAHGWDLEEQAVLLDWLQTKGVLDANVLAEDSLGRDSEDIKKFLDGVEDRMKQAGLVETNNVTTVIAFLSAEVSLARAAMSAMKEKNAQRKCRASKEVSTLKKKIEEERNRKLELEKLRKKRKRELEEGRSRLETEMQQRRELELERSQLKLQINDAVRDESREAERCRITEEENDMLRVREAEARNHLEESRLKILSLRALAGGISGFSAAGVRVEQVGDGGSDNESNVPRRSNTNDGDHTSADVNALTADRRDYYSSLTFQQRTGLSGRASQSSPHTMSDEEIGKLRLEIRRLRALEATLKAETEDWKAHLNSERRRFRFVQQAKIRLEYALRISSTTSSARRTAITTGAAGPPLPPQRTTGGSTAAKMKANVAQLPPQPTEAREKKPTTKVKTAQTAQMKPDASTDSVRRKSKDVYRSISVG